ncbi:MAG: ATP-binding cassette domain-containing protein [Armatimonadetes bacterium]|nr:ATP-binding cassette domain-containing protein [Armatimonadota bacterium]
MVEVIRWMMISGTPLFHLSAVSKSFGGVPVLNAVDFDLFPGEVHTLMGENGAGKSTLTKILGGIHQPDSGQILLDGKPVDIPSPHVAQQVGIALMHQEPLNFPDLDVAENIFMGRGEHRGPLRLRNWTAMYAEARELLASMGLDLDPRAKLRGLSLAAQQMVEMAGALSQKARVLLMDEPTAALTPQEVRELFLIINRLKGQGVALVFISHRLGEVLEISDRITVLRDGELVGTRLKSETSKDEILKMMVGRPLSALFEKDRTTIGAPLLRVVNLSRRGRFSDISFEVHGGEIVGLAGLVGAGRTEVAQSIFGLSPPESGAVWVAGKEARLRSPGQALGLGLAYVPEDRQQHGLLLPFAVFSNISLPVLRRLSPKGWLRPGVEREQAEKCRADLDIHLRDVDQPARELSGGNQQKVVLSKWLLTDPRVLILDEPTRGIDIGAKAEVHRLMSQLAQQGKAILMISSDLPEILAMSDRILVMREGRLTGEFERSEATQERIMAAATGQSLPRKGMGGGREDGPVGQSRGPCLTSPTLSFGNSRWFRFREIGIAFVVALVVLLATLTEPRFLSPENIRNILLYIPLITVVAMAEMMVLISRNIDLSVGSVLGFSAIVVGNAFIRAPELSLWLAALLSVCIGGALGAVNGALVTWMRVPAIIATLGTLSAYRGLVFIVSGGRQVDPNDIPPDLIRLSQTSPLGVPWIVLFAAIVAAMTFVFLRYTPTGRQIYAVGSNPLAARLRGLAVDRVVFLVFMLSGAAAGLAGFMYASRFGYVNPGDTGVGFELVVISAAILGGTNVFGGSGSVMGTLLGGLLLGVINVALAVLHISAFWQLATYGIAILTAVTVDTGIQRRMGR